MSITNENLLQNISLGNFFRQLQVLSGMMMHERGFNAKCARIIGVNRDTVRRWKNFQRSPQLKYRELVSKLFEEKKLKENLDIRGVY